MKINGEYSVTYSPMNYCSAALVSDQAETSLKNAVKALYLYALEAAEYFKER